MYMYEGSCAISWCAIPVRQQAALEALEYAEFVDFSVDIGSYLAQLTMPTRPFKYQLEIFVVGV